MSSARFFKHQHVDFLLQHIEELNTDELIKSHCLLADDSVVFNTDDHKKRLNFWNSELKAEGVTTAQLEHECYELISLPDGQVLCNNINAKSSLFDPEPFLIKEKKIYPAWQQNKESVSNLPANIKNAHYFTRYDEDAFLYHQYHRLEFNIFQISTTQTYEIEVGRCIYSAAVSQNKIALNLGYSLMWLDKKLTDKNALKVIFQTTPLIDDLADIVVSYAYLPVRKLGFFQQPTVIDLSSTADEDLDDQVTCGIM